MKTTLRVLIIEDSEDDALLLAREIKKNNYDVTFRRVDTSDAMSEALNQQKWDIIISDYNMPHFSVSEALELLRNSGLDLPFIIVSGVIGEEAAVDSLKAGAHDFIMKSNFSRFIPAIKRELNEAEVRRSKRIAEKKLKHLNLVLRAIRSVNQLIIREKDRDRLLKSTCENLIENREYYNAWIILLDESGEFLRHAEAGLGKDFLP
ncbi:response regulator, partial [candidate division KSB1 bacterium]|nr:response regulator [candidate division KSB1 bacterium]